ncbi:hypothetical protein [Devosia sp.]|uniref:hypothetical protein n=1 Tax=Devosia sp. TaxID=1871048 RepID=UPI002FC5C46E
MTTLESTARSNREAGKVAPRYVAWSAYAVPVLILTGFGLVTTLPIVLMSYGVLRDARVKALRWWVGLTAGLFAIPLVGWLFRADPEASLSSMLHPSMAGAIVLSSLVVIAKIVRSHRG